MRITTKNDISLLEFIRQDCRAQGYGRKKWWAEQIGVSQMMLSHWLVGRRNPNAIHLNKLYSLYEQIRAGKNKRAWSQFIWGHYYDNLPLAPPLLRSVAERLLLSDGLPTRTLALLSWFFDKYRPEPFETPYLAGVGALRNKLGWLYESAGCQAGYEPDRVDATIPLLEISSVGLTTEEHLQRYLEKQQTQLGRRWQVYDCKIDGLKEQLSWRN